MSIRILIVEDSPTDRELLRYLLESKFGSEAKFREAYNLESAVGFLDRGNTDCIVLDLQLPDSAGKETFLKLSARYPDVPIIVMTHNKDRNLAIEMIRSGAADYVLKNYTDEEDIFRRIIFAVEKHKHTMRITPDDATSLQRLDRAKANMLSTHKDEPTHTDKTIETTSAVAEIAKRMFIEVQLLRAEVAKVTSELERIAKITEALDLELMRGYPNKPSLRSKVDQLSQNVETLIQVRKVQSQSKISIQRAFLIGVLALLGVLSISAIGYYAMHTSPHSHDRP